MILRKPYAFLIKYFKVINLFLAVLAIYLSYRTYNIITFFNEYITHKYSGNYYPGFFNTYISPFLNLVTILLIVGIFVIVILFLYKKKPTKLYVMGILFYIVFIMFLNTTKNTMVTMQISVLSAETSRIFRDLSIVSLVIQSIFVILFLLRGFGFQIHRFNFESDLKELEITSEDNEEIEVTIKGDSAKIKRNIRRYFREFKYYLKENKIMIIMAIIILGLIIYFFINVESPQEVDTSYNQGQSFIYSGINYSVEDSMITNLDYKGDVINKDKFYLVLSILVENNNNEDVSIDYNNYRLVVNNNYYYPSKNKEIYFVDYAVANINTIIRANTKNKNLLVFELNKEDLGNNYKLKINNGVTYAKNSNKGKYIIVNLSPVNISIVNLEKTTSLGKELSLVDTNLGKTKITFSNMKILDRYKYEYESCLNKDCKKYIDLITTSSTSDKSLIILDTLYEFDDTVPFRLTSSSISGFVDYFVKIKYIVDGDEKILKMKNVTPDKLKDKIALEVDKDIKNAEEIKLMITIRNKEYDIKLK